MERVLHIWWCNLPSEALHLNNAFYRVITTPLSPWYLSLTTTIGWLIQKSTPQIFTLTWQYSDSKCPVDILSRWDTIKQDLKTLSGKTLSEVDWVSSIPILISLHPLHLYFDWLTVDWYILRTGQKDAWMLIHNTVRHLSFSNITSYWPVCLSIIWLSLDWLVWHLSIMAGKKLTLLLVGMASSLLETQWKRWEPFSGWFGLELKERHSGCHGMAVYPTLPSCQLTSPQYSYNVPTVSLQRYRATSAIRLS